MRGFVGGGDAAQDAFGVAPVVGVADADQHHAVRAEGVGVALEDGPGIAQILQHFVVDDAVDAAGDVEGQGAGFEVGGDDLVEVGCGAPGCGGVDVDAE